MEEFVFFLGLIMVFATLLHLWAALYYTRLAIRLKKGKFPGKNSSERRLKNPMLEEIRKNRTKRIERKVGREYKRINKMHEKMITNETKRKVKKFQARLATFILKGTDLCVAHDDVVILENKLDVKTLRVKRMANKYATDWIADDMAREIGNLIKEGDLWEFKTTLCSKTDVVDVEAVVKVVVGNEKSYTLAYLREVE